MYMITIIYMFNRKIVYRSISNTMNMEWCAQVYQDSIEKKSEIINSDQRSQFTSPVFTKLIIDNKVKFYVNRKEENSIIFI